LLPGTELRHGGFIVKGLSQQEKQDALKAFVEVEETTLPLVDRSTVESWDCPWKGKAIEEGRALPVGILAEAGNAVHDAFSAAILEHIESNGGIGAHDLRQDVEFSLRNSRPDIQPEAIKGGRPAAWAWTKALDGIHPENILAFDGGEAIGRSGQFAWDCADLGVRYTLELDFLFAGASSEVLHIWDYKSGWKGWDIDGIKDSFQFQSQAALVLQRYNKCRPGEDEPTVKCVTVQVWNTRANRLTPRVEFPRRNLHDYECRIRNQLLTRKRHWDNPPTWPYAEKCSVCPAATICPVSTYPIKADKVEVLRDLIATRARADALEQILSAHVDATGEDLRCGSVAYGRSKPKTERKSPATLYDIKD
jgi:hypothetical protein